MLVHVLSFLISWLAACIQVKKGYFVVGKVNERMMQPFAFDLAVHHCPFCFYFSAYHHFLQHAHCFLLLFTLIYHRVGLVRILSQFISSYHCHFGKSTAYSKDSPNYAHIPGQLCHCPHQLYTSLNRPSIYMVKAVIYMNIDVIPMTRIFI